MAGFLDLFLRICVEINIMILGFYYTFKEQIFDRPRVPDIPTDRHNKTIVITGGSRGIGLEAVKKFISRGCYVIVGCRSPEKARANFSPSQLENIKLLKLDLSNLESIREFVAEVSKLKVTIDVLVNNAGIANTIEPRSTVPGSDLEVHFATNYLGPFLLTHLLTPMLKQDSNGHPGRIINVSSVVIGLNMWMNLDDLQLEEAYAPILAYGMSKAEQVMFSQFLDSKISAQTGIRVVAVHPGIVFTEMSMHGQPTFVKKIAPYTMKSASQGGDTLLHAALSPELDTADLSGVYLENCRPASIGKKLSSLQNQEKLWRTTCQMLNIDNFGDLSL